MLIRDLANENVPSTVIRLYLQPVQLDFVQIILFSIIGGLDIFFHLLYTTQSEVKYKSLDAVACGVENCGGYITPTHVHFFIYLLHDWTLNVFSHLRHPVSM